MSAASIETPLTALSVQDCAAAKLAANPVNETPFVRCSLAAIIGAGLLIYWSALDVPFLFDDWRNIVMEEHSLVHRLWPWGPLPLARCVATWTLQLNYALGGLNLTGFHATNIAIHLAAACVLFDLVRRCASRNGIPAWLAEERRWLALSAALIWLAHPLQPQAVTYIVQRCESLMGLCYLLTLYCLVRGAESRRSWAWYAAAVAACWAGAGSKEVMISAPLVTLLFDRAYLAGSWPEIVRRRWCLYLGLFASATWLVYGARSALLGGNEHGIGFGGASVSTWEYLRSQPAVLLHYLRLVFWPDVLLLDYGWPVETSPWRIYGLGAVILLMLGASAWAFWRFPWIGMLGLAFFLILAPTSSIVPIDDLAFEQRMYLPLACVVLLVLVGAAAAVSRLIADAQRRSRVMWGGAALVVAALAARTALRNAELHDPIGMWERMAAYNPQHARHFCILAKYYQDASRFDDAVAAFERSLALRPGDHYVWTEFGNLFFTARNYDRAVELYHRAIELNPTSFRAHANIGRSELIRGNYAAALAASRDALACEPQNPIVRKQVAWLLATAPDERLHSGPEALRLIEEIPQDAWHVDIQWQEVHAAALAEVGRFADAVAASQRAVNTAESIHSKRVGELRAQLASYQARKPWRLEEKGLGLVSRAWEDPNGPVNPSPSPSPSPSP